jgi:uncharacterized protein
MVFIRRQAEKTLERLAHSFPAVLVTGARQTGKSTLLTRSPLTGGMDYITFDDPDAVSSFRADPKTFLALHSPPVIFDEIQHVPDIFLYLKMDIDRNRRNGMYYLTGSQQFELMQNVSETLAGRIGIMHLPGISLDERLGREDAVPFIPSKEFLFSRRTSPHTGSPEKLWQIIQGGSFPQIVTGEIQPNDYYGSYVKTYVERDVRQLTQVADEMQFINFITVAAARTGSLVNYADMAKETGISEVTAKKWLSVLVTAGLVYLLQPYSANVEKRVIKTPKLYFMDTGLAAYLSKWRTADVLMTGAMAGPYFETFVVSEILKTFYNAGRNPPVYFYRDKDKIEIDLLIEDNGMLYPVEIKKTASPSKKDIRSFPILQRIRMIQIRTGSVVCSGASLGSIAPDIFSVPVEFI